MPGSPAFYKIPQAHSIVDVPITLSKPFQKELPKLKQHVVPVRVEKYLDALPPETHGMPVNLYYTDSYLVISAGLPRCLPDKIHVFVAPAKMLIRAERHPGEQPVHEERAYILSELPEGAVGRVIDLPQGEWAYDAAEAHFANGLLTVSIPTQARAEYLRQKHAV